jgi:hypothetical protein
MLGIMMKETLLMKKLYNQIIDLLTEIIIWFTRIVKIILVSGIIFIGYAYQVEKEIYNFCSARGQELGLTEITLLMEGSSGRPSFCIGKNPSGRWIEYRGRK